MYKYLCIVIHLFNPQKTLKYFYVLYMYIHTFMAIETKKKKV